MKTAAVHPLDELFTHVQDDAAGTQTTYNVTQLYEHLVAHPTDAVLVSVPLDDEHGQYCLTQRGVEQDRLAVLAQHPEYLKKPLVFVAMGDGSHLLVDGTHRYVIRWLLKGQFVPAYIVPMAVAAPFIVEDLPESSPEELMAWSGISLIRQLTQKES
jgi:hypothetical protein